MDDPTGVFVLKQGLTEQALLENIRHRLQQLRDMATVMEGKDFYIHPPTVLQGYSWVMVDLIDEVQALFSELRKRK
jgi:hypothetical protein